jgi:hypothetical protein
MRPAGLVYLLLTLMLDSLSRLQRRIRRHPMVTSLLQPGPGRGPADDEVLQVVKVSPCLLQRPFCGCGLAGCACLAVGLFSLVQGRRGLPYRVRGGSAVLVELSYPVRDADGDQRSVLGAQVVHCLRCDLGAAGSLISLSPQLLQGGRGIVHSYLSIARQDRQPGDVLLQRGKSRHVLIAGCVALTSQFQRRSLWAAR